MEKAKYYHNRSMFGQLEPETSPLKEMVMRKLKVRENKWKDKERVNSKAHRKYIPIIDIDNENEHHLYLTSSDDEELPISMKVSQMQKEDECDRLLKRRSSNPKALPMIALYNDLINTSGDDYVRHIADNSSIFDDSVIKDNSFKDQFKDKGEDIMNVNMKHLINGVGKIQINNVHDYNMIKDEL